MAGLKLWLVHDEEIVARFQPLDDLWQLLAAARGYWFADTYNWMMYVRLPVYPLWIKAVQITGVPLRVAIELVFLASSFLFSLALVRASVPKIIAAAVYLVIIFHPASFSLFNYSLAETLYAPAITATLAALILVWVDRHSPKLPRNAALAAICLAALWHIRPEGELVMLLLVSFGAGAWGALWLERTRRPEVVRFLKLAVLMPAIVIFASTTALKSANWLKTGLFISTEMSSPGYLAAYKALLRIKPQETIRFIPVTREVRQRAYAASPAFNELQPFIEGENFGTLETFRSIGVENEIAAGWFYWILRQAAASAGHGGSARDMDAFFQKIADEIAAAIDSGKLDSRVVWSQFIDPDTTNYMSHLPESLAKISAVFISTAAPGRETEADVDPQTRRVFDRLANRRTTLTTNAPTTISGWVFIEGADNKSISIKDLQGGSTIAVVGQFSKRADVSSGFRAAGIATRSDQLGFTLSPELAGWSSRYVLSIEGSDGCEARIALDTIEAGKVLTTASCAGKPITFAVDQIVDPSRAPAATARLQHTLWSTYGAALVPLGYAAMIALGVLIVCCRSIDTSRGVFLVMWILAAAVASRVLLFTVLDASSWPGNQTRYLFPAMQLYAPLLILLLYTALDLLGRRFFTGAKRGTPGATG